jgi:hypothetical protein
MRNKKVIVAGVSVVAAVFIAAVVAGLYAELPAVSEAVGIYDKVGTNSWMEWKADGTAVSYNEEKGGYYYGTWEQVDENTVVANYEHAPPNLTYILTEEGCIWGGDTIYIKRVD